MWRVLDSNQGGTGRQIYSLLPSASRATLRLTSTILLGLSRRFQQHAQHAPSGLPSFVERRRRSGVCVRRGVAPPTPDVFTGAFVRDGIQLGVGPSASDHPPHGLDRDDTHIPASDILSAKFRCHFTCILEGVAITLRVRADSVAPVALDSIFRPELHFDFPFFV